MSSWVALAAVVVATGCTFDPSGAGGRAGGDGGPSIDAEPIARPDAEPGAPARHLVLSEVKAVASPDDSEFIEIFNPTDATIALDDYYLADDDDYFRLPEAVALGGELLSDPASDFVARFPAGAVIGPGQALVIATEQNGYEGEFGVAPDFKTGGGNAETMDVLYGSSNPSITDLGEAVMLFRWDGQTDLVTDVDQVLVGDLPGPSNLLPDKSGIAIDGPDGDGLATAYAAEAASIVASLTRTAADESYERVALEAGHEAATGGNGLGGHDETSEDTLATWEQAGFGPATPGQVPPALR